MLLKQSQNQNPGLVIPILSSMNRKISKVEKKQSNLSCRRKGHSIYLTERKEGRNKRGWEGGKERKRETVFSSERPRRINIRQERRKLESRVALGRCWWRQTHSN